MTNRFSLRFLFHLFLAVSILLTVCFIKPSWLSSICLMISSLVLFSVLVVTIIYGSGDLRAFCVGATIPMLLLMVVVASFVVVLTFDSNVSRLLEYSALERYAPGLRHVSILLWLLTVLMGFLAVAIRKQIQS